MTLATDKSPATQLAENGKTARNSGMIYCGAHYSLCPVEVRELWAKGFALNDGPTTLKQIVERQAGHATTEMVVITTCNRFDLCLFGHLQNIQLERIFIEFAEWTLAQFPNLQSALDTNRNWRHELRAWLRSMSDEHALQHLFRVGCSLDSLVLGEPHILGQLKDSFQNALTNGFCSQEATTVFNRTFQVAKRVRSETDLGKNAISIGHAAVEIIRRVFDNLNKQKCLILGAGEMARITTQHLRACGAENLTIANRTLSRSQKLAEQIEHSQALLLETALTRLHEFDIIIAATSAQGFIVHKKHLETLLKRRSGVPIVIVDISVPRNVDPELGKLKNLFLFDVDDLDKVMESSRQARRKAAQEAEEIISAEVSEFLSQRRQRENLINVGRFHSLVRNVVEAEIKKSLSKSQSLDESQITITANAVAKKLVAQTAQLARADVRIDSEQDTIGQALGLLFNLSQSENEES